MTQQPPGGSPEGGYAQPQDPWAGAYEPGIASVPTDPIPQQYDPYADAGPGEVWNQNDPRYGYAAPPRNTSKILGIGLLVLLLAGGAGYGAYYYTTKGANPTGGPTAGVTNPSTTHTSSAPPTTEPAAFDPHTVAEGQCVFNFGTLKVPKLQVVDCTTAKSYKVIKIVMGEQIPENAQGKFDDQTSVAMCADTGYQTYYGYQDNSSDTRDVFFCMTNNP